MAVTTLSIDTSQIAGLGNKFEQAARESPAAIARAVRRTGDMTATKVEVALTDQTGLKRGVIKRAVKRKPGGMTYTLQSRGGNVSLKHFKARETRRGVSAAPWNARRVFPGTFIKGGLFPKRKGIGLGGQVFARVGKRRTPIARQKSGLFIPTEMVSGATASAFLSSVQTILPQRLQHELGRILGG